MGLSSRISKESSEIALIEPSEGVIVLLKSLQQASTLVPILVC
jgi:hypothetical protein